MKKQLNSDYFTRINKDIDGNPKNQLKPVSNNLSLIEYVLEQNDFYLPKVIEKKNFSKDSLEEFIIDTAEWDKEYGRN